MTVNSGGHQNRKKRELVNDLTHALTMSPPVVTEIPANIALPPAVKKAQAKTLAAYDAWAETENALVVAQADIDTARIEFDSSIRTAARTGKPCPEPLNLADLENRVRYLAELERMKRGEVDSAETELQAAIHAHRVTIAMAVIETVEKGIDEHRTQVLELAEQLERIEAARREAYAGLSFFAHFTSPELAYVFDAGVHEVRLPSTHETSARNAVTGLQRFIDLATERMADPGQPDESAVEAVAVAPE